jgi:Ca2+-binding RTX toxin-like protein
MSDLHKAELLLAKYKARVEATGFDISFINNDVHISNQADSPSFGIAGAGHDFIWADRTTGGEYFGFDGNDIFVGTSGVAETFHGGRGADTIAYVNATEGIVLTLPDQPVFFSFIQGGAAAGDVLDSIENAVGSAFADTINGDAQSNLLFGGDGDDHMFGSGGIDRLDGGNGNDVLAAGIDPANAFQVDSRDANFSLIRESLHGNAGNDLLISGPNRDSLDGGTEAPGVVPPVMMLGHLGVQGDTASYESSNAGVTINLGTGAASGGFAEGDVLQGMENLIGSDLRDVLTGNAGANVLDGGLDNDVLTGAGGNDTFLFRFDQGTTGFDVVTDLTASDKVVLDTDRGIHLSQLGNDTIVTVDGFDGGITLRDIHALSLGIDHSAAGFILHL